MRLICIISYCCDETPTQLRSPSVKLGMLYWKKKFPPAVYYQTISQAFIGIPIYLFLSVMKSKPKDTLLAPGHR